MREHLFRGKRAENSGTSSEQAGEWIEGYLTEYLRGDKGRIGISRKGIICEVIPYTVQEYTGKNIPKTDQKIFEGHVIAMESMMNSEKYYVVTWNDSKCSFELRGLKNNRMRFDMEIIDAISDVQIVGNNEEPLEELK